MVKTVEAIYENGVLHPLQSLVGITEHCKVKVTVEVETPPHPLADCIGILPDEDAAEMLRVIEDEFEKVNPSEWQ
jgi:predicted DNA-binding antitoxin AbrB/MazE fold protein